MKKGNDMPIQYNPYRLFSYNFSRLLSIRGLSQSQAAEKLGVCAAATINLWANGRRLPSAESLSVIAQELNVPVAELFFDPESSPFGLPGIEANTPVLAMIDSLPELKSSIAKHLQRNPSHSFGIRVTKSYAEKNPVFSFDDVLICTSPLTVSPGKCVLYDRENTLIAMRAFSSDDKNLLLAPLHPCFGSESIVADAKSKPNILCVISFVQHQL